jgi:hypothetical protein
MANPLAPAPIIPLNERPVKNTIVLFDVDDTLTPARRVSQFCGATKLVINWNYRIQGLPSKCGADNAF